MNDSQRYEELKGRTGKIFLKEGIRQELSEAEAVIFDCDGVLIDSRHSYNKAISETVGYLLEKLTGQKEKLDEEGLLRLVMKLRSTGGFNNDWDTTYSILLLVLSKLEGEYQIRMRSRIEELLKLSRGKGAAEIVRAMESFGPPPSFPRSLNDFLVSLGSQQRIADVRGIVSVEEALLRSSDQEGRDFVGLLKEFLSYPGEVGKSLIPTCFNAFFYGTELDPRVSKTILARKKRPLIESEKVIVSKGALEFFSRTFNGNLGIASGRSLWGTRETLGDLMDYFNPRALAFTEDDADATGRKELAKPHPYPLLRSSSGLGCSGKVIYVGDSAEDAMMVIRANETERRFIFAGVYGISIDPEEQISLLKGLDAGLIAPRVEDLANLLRRVRAEK